MKIPQDVIVQLAPEGRWILFNVFSRDVLAVSSDALACVSALQTNGAPLSDASYTVWDIGYFSNAKGLLADPTPWIRDVASWPEPQTLSGDAFVELLRSKNFLIEDEDAYRSKFARKTSLLDTQHFGNFHEQLGQTLMVKERLNPSDWWARQKFSEDFTALNDTLYKAIQGRFLEDFFQKTFQAPQRIIDLGCGTGFYTKQMAKNGAEVIGIDPSTDYIDIAKRDAPANCTFRVAEVGKPDALDDIPAHSMDVVFMSDALLFYFVSPDPKEQPDIQSLFEEVKRLLKPGGRFYSMEPHGIFWLRPWLGEADRPFTILTEYVHKQFKVAPNPSELIQSYLRGGFTLRNMQELKPDPAYAKRDPRGTAFANEFPLWWFFELSYDG